MSLFKYYTQIARLNLCLLLLLPYTLAFAISDANDDANVDKAVLYKIQVGAYAQASLTNYANIQHLGTLYLEQTNSDLKRVLLGDFTLKNEAEKALQELQKLGYSDAFITTRQHETEKQYVIAKMEQAALIQASKKTTAKAMSESVNVATNAVADNEVVHYIIQLGVYKTVDYNWFVEASKLGEIFVQIKNNTTYVSLGVFKSREKAEKVLKQLKGNTYYKKSFIKTDVNSWLG